MSIEKTRRREALILVAHADDETLGAGGTIQKLVRGEWDVSVVIVSDGIVSARGAPQDNREHAHAACALLGVGEPRFLGFKDQLFDQFTIAEMANAVFAVGAQPDLIITHASTDLNSDHRIVGELAKIVSKPRGRSCSLLACEVPSTTQWNGVPFPANYYVEIEQELETKIKAFSCYENELSEYPHPWSPEGLRLLADYHGMQSGLKQAEAFHMIRGYAGLLP
jgi:LmbE family N-acetylglucosaminyl deacetylase